ncbi:hypothetical protein GGR56DRAFT_11001 [Xylariaceae sp. FL0804]|nr:hypothetical protein GGR56DRAFT_11001 [Xylariaceae sp. FL0804]
MGLDSLQDSRQTDVLTQPRQGLLSRHARLCPLCLKRSASDISHVGHLMRSSGLAISRERDILCQDKGVGLHGLADHRAASVSWLYRNEALEHMQLPVESFERAWATADGSIDMFCLVTGNASNRASEYGCDCNLPAGWARQPTAAGETKDWTPNFYVEKTRFPRAIPGRYILLLSTLKVSSESVRFGRQETHSIIVRLIMIAAVRHPLAPKIS